jgi:hypothetical protein
MTADEYNQQQIAAGKYTPPMQAVAASAGGVPALQRFYGLTPDGKVGPNTQKVLSALVSSLTPIPWGRDGLTNTYGKFSYTEAAGGRIDIDPAWTTANIGVYTLHTGRIVKMHKLAGAEFVRLYHAACLASGYTPTSVQTFVPRHTLWDPSKPLSLHSWGIAVDFDPASNTMSGTDGHGGPSLMRQHPAFVKVFTDAGWTWGGNWDMKDDMHFQRAYV